jgi:hypothetical protein
MSEAFSQHPDRTALPGSNPLGTLLSLRGPLCRNLAELPHTRGLAHAASKQRSPACDPHLPPPTRTTVQLHEGAVRPRRRGRACRHGPDAEED